MKNRWALTFVCVLLGSELALADHSTPIVPPYPQPIQLECVWTNPAYQPFNVITRTLVGTPGFGYLSRTDCEMAIAATNTDGLVCNWNGGNFQPYDIWSNSALGNQNHGFRYTYVCNSVVSSAKNGLACMWNGTNNQPYRISGNLQIGQPNFGFNDVNVCNQAVQGSINGMVCNWYGSGFMAYDVRTNTPADGGYRRFPTLYDCNDYLANAIAPPPPPPPPPPYEKETTIKCKSNEFTHSNCDVAGFWITKAWVIKVQSNASCIEGSSWGITADHTAIWVDHGCEAIFGVRGLPR